MLMTMLKAIDHYLGTSRISASRFGREAAGDPRLVFDMRKGRRPGASMIERINAYLGRIAR
jgi:hypothetical protein